MWSGKVGVWMGLIPGKKAADAGDEIMLEYGLHDEITDANIA